MKKLAAAAFASALLISLAADAASPQIVATAAALRAGNFGSYPTISLSGYYSTSTVGGGVFVKGTATSDDGGTIINDAAGNSFYRQTNGRPYDVSWFGAKCGGVQVVNGVSTSGSHTVTSASNRWTAAMVGWVAVVNKAAASSKQLVTTVSGFTNAGSVTLTAAAGASGTAETISLYPDDTTAFSKTVLAANRDNVDMTFPAGQTCGVANPGTASSWNLTFPNLRLNGATVWLGHTGATSDTGWSFNMLGINYSGVNWSGVSVVGPGVVDGLYQTNQNIAQMSLTDAFIWNNGGSNIIQNASITGAITIQNTKGTAISAEGVNNFTIDNVLAQNCGDYTYQHSSTPGDMAGRPMCVTISASSGAVNVSNFTALNAAQAGILFLSSPSQSAHISLTNCYFSGNGYYGFDAEVVGGAIDMANCRNVGNGVAPAGALISGGFQWRDVAYIRANNVESYLVDSNAFLAQSVDGDSNQTDWSFSNLDITGTANHAGQIYIAFSSTGVPQRIALENVNYDTLTVAPTSSPACSATKPQFQLFKFHNIHASQNAGPTYSTIFNPQAAASQMLYILGSDSSLGAVSVASLGGTNVKWGYFDLFRVQMDGAPAFSGGVASGTYGGTTWTNPLTSFTCP